MVQKRLLPPDFLRGLVMLLLALEAPGLYHVLNGAAEYTNTTVCILLSCIFHIHLFFVVDAQIYIRAFVAIFLTYYILAITKSNM